MCAPEWRQTIKVQLKKKQNKNKIRCKFKNQL
jgi:hypothetical protein